MKKVYLPIVFLLITVLVNAQNFQVKIMDTDTVVSNNDTLTAYGMADQFDIKRHFVIENLTSAQLNMNIVRENIEIVEGMSSVFCLNVCYPASTTEVDFTVAADGTQALDVDLWCGNTSGEALVKVTLTDTDGTETLEFFCEVFCIYCWNFQYKYN
jgi:hypothetical protein